MTTSRYNLAFLNDKTVLITGGAGFIGFHLASKLLKETTAHLVIVDSVNSYYSSSLKWARLAQLGIDKKGNAKDDRITFHTVEIADNAQVEKVYELHSFDLVVNLAAQAGVRYSLENPDAYIQSNINGFFNILNGAVKNGVKLLLYASSSSVYGGSQEVPFRESAPLAAPLSLYAATKMSNELIATTFSQNYGISCIGMRFFNVYGSWGRPDAVYYLWADAILNGRTLEVRGEGRLRRDMTFIDDVTESIAGLISHYWLGAKPVHEVYNIGNSQPVIIQSLLDYMANYFKQTPEIAYVEKGPEEIDVTCADTSKLQSVIGFAPSTPIDSGMKEFLEWFTGYAEGGLVS